MQWILVAIIVVAAIWYLVGGRKKSWWKVEDADGTIRILCRNQFDMFSSNGSVLVFKTEIGTLYKTNWHWVKSIEEISADRLKEVREELLRKSNDR